MNGRIDLRAAVLSSQASSGASLCPQGRQRGWRTADGAVALVSPLPAPEKHRRFSSVPGVLAHAGAGGWGPTLGETCQSPRISSPSGRPQVPGPPSPWGSSRCPRGPHPAARRPRGREQSCAGGPGATGGGQRPAPAKPGRRPPPAPQAGRARARPATRGQGQVHGPAASSRGRMARRHEHRQRRAGGGRGFPSGAGPCRSHVPVALKSGSPPGRAPLPAGLQRARLVQSRDVRARGGHVGEYLDSQDSLGVVCGSRMLRRSRGFQTSPWGGNW